MGQVKLGITLYSFSKEYCEGSMTLEDCIATAKRLGAEGFEIVATQMIPSYPYVSDLFLGEIKANKMGCKVIREQYLLSPSGLYRLAPYAEAYNVKVGIEIHNPETPNTPIMREYLEAIKASGSKYIGFVPDFGLFATKPNKPNWDKALQNGAKLRLLEMARDMRYAEVPVEEAQKKLLAEGATQVEMASLQAMYAFLQFRKDCNKELEGLKEIMPYCFHMHGKFHYLSEDFVEASIPYDQILKVVKESDYNE